MSYKFDYHLPIRSKTIRGQQKTLTLIIHRPSSIYSCKLYNISSKFKFENGNKAWNSPLIFSHCFHLSGESGWMLPGVRCRIGPASVRLTGGLSSLCDRDRRVSSVSRAGQKSSDRGRVRVPIGWRLLLSWKLDCLYW